RTHWRTCWRAQSAQRLRPPRLVSLRWSGPVRLALEADDGRIAAQGGRERVRARLVEAADRGAELHHLVVQGLRHRQGPQAVAAQHLAIGLRRGGPVAPVAYLDVGVV